MNRSIFLNGIALFIGLSLTAYSLLNNNNQRSTSTSPPAVEQEQEFKLEKWQLSSIYDGDTLRVTRENEELKIRLCGIDAPEHDQKLGIEARDHLRTLVSIGNGELLLLPIEKDRYGRTVTELYVRDSKNTAINLNMQMLRDGYAWLYAQYFDNCPTRNKFVLAEELGTCPEIKYQPSN